ncbi:MAG: hypothetical protein SW833_00060 [Cyanobacteriota bacterium]|nr:hypothetical protein [Cyanobacteriota bacterium]
MFFRAIFYGNGSIVGKIDLNRQATTGIGWETQGKDSLPDERVKPEKIVGGIREEAVLQHTS